MRRAPPPPLPLGLPGWGRARACAVIGAGAAAGAIACGGPTRPTSAPAPPSPAASPGAALAPAPEAEPVPAWTYWEPIEAPLPAVGPTPTALPLAPAELRRSPAADRRWLALSPAAREAVLHRGFTVVAAARPSARLGDFYAAARDDLVPWVVTLDALFFLTHLALDRAFADVDASVVGPAVATILRRLEARLAAESGAARPDVAPSYVIARGIVAVAVALALPEPTRADPSGLAPLAFAERARVLAHAGVAVSPWLGSEIDYGAMAPRGVADRDDPRIRGYLALAWLQNATLGLEGNGERGARAAVDVATARRHARAALLLSRALDPEVEPEAGAAWRRLERAGELLVGGPDDVTPRDLSVAVARAELDLRDADWFANVARVDRVRHAAAGGRPAAVFRLVAPRLTPDAELLQALSFPVVGRHAPPLAAGVADATSPPPPPVTLRDGLRALPTALDVAAWLGSGEARAALAQTGDDAYEGYADTLDRLIRERPPESAPATSGRHRTPYLSMIDAIEVWLAPSAGDGAVPAASTSAWRKRKADVALAAWTELRHDATAATRIPLSDFRLALRERVAPAPAAFVEPHPEAIARLVAVVRQTARALVGEGMLAPDAPALRALEEIDDLLWIALGAATYETADEPLPPELVEALASFPARLRALEAVLADTGGAEVPLGVDVHVDRASARVLDEATGRIEEAWIAIREPRSRRIWLALGASIPHFEIVQPASARLTDDGWRARLRDEGEPPPGPLARDYRAPPGPAPERP